MNDEHGLIEAGRNLLGGAGLSLVGAMLGRFMWHVNEVRKQNRKLFSKELIWEFPIAIGMGFVAEGLASYYSLSDEPRVALIVALSYLGPRGIEAILSKWVKRKA